MDQIVLSTIYGVCKIFDDRIRFQEIIEKFVIIFFEFKPFS